MQIITDWKMRPLLALADLPEEAQKDFDYIEEWDSHTARFAHYRGEYYDVFDVQRIEPDNSRAHPMGWAVRVHPGSPLCLFDSIVSDSYFSGTLFKLDSYNESVMCGRYFT
mgnify:FL=1